MYEALRRSAPAGGIDAHAVQRALGLRSQYLAERLLVALSGDRPFRTAQEFIAWTSRAACWPRVRGAI